MASPNTTSSSDAIPLVIVQGFLGTAKVSWSRHINASSADGLCCRKVLVPSLGPVSSLHDRACELYYSLAGGRVDYGAQHSILHKHARYGRTFPVGLYPKWSVQRPLHFLGHSIGGPTVVKLQHLLQEGHFGKDGHPDMILSLNAVCSPFRGTQLVYTLGESLTAAPDVRPFSVGSLLTKLIHMTAYLSPLLPAIFDVHADARALSYRESSLLNLGKQLWKSDWAESQDAVPYDMTFQAAELREISFEGRTYQKTFYRSHVSRMTCKMKSSLDDFQHKPLLWIFSFAHHLLYFWARAIGAFDYTAVHPPPSAILGLPAACPQKAHSKISILQGEEYWANDGVVPVFSQWHPLACRLTACEHDKDVRALPPEAQTENIDVTNDQLNPGFWHVLTTDDTTHLWLIPSFIGQRVYQKTFWLEYGLWLDAVDLLNEERLS